MRIAVFILCLVAGAAICQQNPLEVCINDLKLALPLVEKIIQDSQSKNILAMISDISIGAVLIDSVKADCKNITKANVIAYAYSKLSVQQKECLGQVLGTVFALYTAKNDLTNKNWPAFFQDLSNVTIDLETTKTICNGAF